MVLLDHLLDGAFIGGRKSLGGQALARRPEARVVHGPLEGIVLPAKDVVAVLAVSGAFTDQSVSPNLPTYFLSYGFGIWWLLVSRLTCRRC